MVQFRPQAREIIAKIVYYGPPLGGKTTNLRTLYKGYPADTRGELVVVPAGGDRTIFFDFLPLDAGSLRSMKLRVQLYTVPGQVHYNATRQIVLRGVDAVVFVADSQRELMRSNRDSWEDLKNNLLLQGLTLSDLPHVLQYNKRDLAEILSVEELDASLNEYNAPFFEAVATVGIGVEETLQNVVKLVARSLRDRFKLGGESAGLGSDLVAMPAMDDVRVGTGGARVMPIAGSGGRADISGFRSSSRAVSALVEPEEDTSGLTHKVKVTPMPVATAAAPDSAPLPVEPPPMPAVEDARPAPRPVQVLVSPEPEVEAAVLTEPERGLPTAAEVFLEPQPALRSESEPPPFDPEDAVAVPAVVAAPAASLDDPFATWDMSSGLAVGDDVFALPAAEVPAVPVGVQAEPVDEAVEGALEPPVDEAMAVADGIDAPELAVAGPEDEAPAAVEIELPPEGSSAIQRAVPRAMAQMGEVRELEVEVPVPAVWTGGKRMTLQLRLTLVPQQDQEDDASD
ncbi:MAG TPA: hypothetical protein PLS53_09520 [Thermoanaerobaculaceae bacterium]|nr:hypothetical protein [Thermoanaerobaculaceae bacterium]